jgi:hypothetical protein
MTNTPKLPEYVEKRFKDWFPGDIYSSQDDELRDEASIKYMLKQFIAGELATFKAQVRKEIEGQITKMENSDWLHGMGLSGSQAEYIEANIKASYLSIPSLKEASNE